MLWILAHYMLYTYIAPFLEQLRLARLLDRVLLTFGIAAIGGVCITGLLIDRHLSRMMLVYLALFATVGLMFGVGRASPTLLYVGVAAWGLSLGGAPTLLQTALANAAGPHADTAQSMLVTVFNLAFAASGALGGILLQTAGVRAIPWALVPLLTAACGVALRTTQQDRHSARMISSVNQSNGRKL